MLRVEYNLKDGSFSNIPNEKHYIVVKHLNKLTTEQKMSFKNFIIKKKLNLTLDESHKNIIENRSETKDIISELELLRKEKLRRVPTLKDMTSSLLLIILMFMLPIYISFYLSSFVQNNWMESFLSFTSNSLHFQSDFLNDILFGDYGLLSLGIYSVVWALPVVIFISISTNIVSESHLKSYIVWSIDPIMTKVGLTGYDIVPVIEGFGCNSAAVL